MELMVSIAILVLITSSVFSILTGLFSDWKRSKEQLKLRSEIVWILETITNYVKNWEEITIIKSEINQRNFNWLLIKNTNSKYKDSLFTIIKPIKSELSERELPVFPWENNYFLWITDDNLFVDVEYSTDLWTIISDPWNWNIWQIKNWVKTKLLWWESSVLFTPTGLFLSKNNLYISDTYKNTIYYISKIDLIAKKESWLKRLVWHKKISSMWFLDWKLILSKLNKPKWITLDSNWNLYIADSWNNAIRIINLSDWEMKTYVWNWEKWINEDDSFHEEFLLNNPTDIEFDSANNLLLVSDTNNNRIIAFWPPKWKWAFLKPYTIAGRWIKSKDIIWDIWENISTINNTKIENPDKYKEIINTKKLSKWWFSWDFSLAKSAQLHHPTWIKSLWKWAFIFSDSWNNLVRLVWTSNFWQCETTNNATFTKEEKEKCKITLKDWDNLIKTIIWNATEIKLWNFNWKDILKNVKAPIWWNKDWKVKFAKLNIPMGIEYWDWKIYFIDNLISTELSDLFWKLNIVSWDDLSFNSDLKIKSLNIDKIIIWKIDDFISTSPINLLLFENKTNNIYPNNDENKSQSLIKLYLRTVSFVEKWEPIETEIETSISPRKIIQKY